MPDYHRNKAIIRVKRRHLMALIENAREENVREKLTHIFSDYNDEDELVIEISDKTST
jgi:chorismate mutase